MTADLLWRDQQGFGIVLEGTSFNHPTFSAQQNYVAGYSIILSALSMALNSRFSNRIVMILVEGEVLQKTSAPPLPWPQDVGALLRRIPGRVGVSLLRLSVQSPPVEASSHKKNEATLTPTRVQVELPCYNAACTSPMADGLNWWSTLYGKMWIMYRETVCGITRLCQISLHLYFHLICFMQGKCWSIE
jgi:hypothetical protein